MEADESCGIGDKNSYGWLSGHVIDDSMCSQRKNRLCAGVEFLCFCSELLQNADHTDRQRLSAWFVVIQNYNRDNCNHITKRFYFSSFISTPPTH